ncbi:MAG: PD-(D/E)XK nuclease family protein, partial [Neisseria sp.]|nr:PD-(D/E)XK nuclease family protein [Neisseria sp.]
LLEGTADAAYHNVEQAYKSSSNTALMLWKNWQRFIQTASEQNLKIEFTDQAPPKVAHRISDVPPVPYQAKSIPERSFQFIRQTSFTGLTRNLPHQAAAEEDNLLPAMDTAETAAAMPSENTAATAAVAEAESADEYSIFHFPRGAAAGVCLHELLEHADFARPAAGQQEAFAGILQKHGFDSIWLPAVSQMTDTALSVPLPDGLTLAQTPPERRLSEMGFLMKMQDFDLGRLKKRLAQSRLPEACLQAAEALDFDTLNGLLNGFIDLTVLLSDGQACIIDYKSNHLGMSAADYHTSALDNAVAAHHYYLQALIYAIAAARYFASRKRPLDTVHIRYYFLRGLNSGTTDGIWAWDIPVGDLAEWL